MGRCTWWQSVGGKEQLVAVIMKMGGARHVSNDRDRHLVV